MKWRNPETVAPGSAAIGTAPAASGKAVRDAAATVRRVTLVIANLGWGGAQKVLVALANQWAEQGWHVTIISMDHEFPNTYFPTHPAVTVGSLGVSGHSHSTFGAIIWNIRRVWRLRQAIRECKAELVVSFLTCTNIRALIAALGTGLPVIVSERGDPQRDALPRVWRFLRCLIYPLAFRLVAQTDAALGCFGPAMRRRGIVIPNPVDVWPTPLESNHHTLVGVGHLADVKGFDLLLQAFALCAERHPAWRVVIWGQGEQCEQLKTLADHLGIAGRTSMPGLSVKPGDWVEHAGIFVLASRHEGFPNALAEAMAAGLPVIATDCPVGGPRTLIRHEQNGLLVDNENVQELAHAIDRLISDHAARQRYGKAAHKSIQRYSAPAIFVRWTELVEQAIDLD